MLEIDIVLQILGDVRSAREERPPPRRVPHVWAYVGEMPGKILIGFQPAGKMETFFQEAAKISDFAADDKLYRACEMEIVGPPLSLG